MNSAQTQKYFWEWGQARAWYVAHGKTKVEADAMRHELHKKALGADKSTKAFTNGDLDKVMAAFRAIHDGGNLNAQMDAEDQPERRRGKIEARAWILAREIWPLPLDRDAEYARRNKLFFLALRICKTPFEKCSDVQLSKVVGALEAQKRRELAKNVERVEVADENPF
jgi:hypothetical protein